MRRHLDERLTLRLPRLYRRLVKLVWALPPGSPVRRRVVKRLTARGWAAQSRQDDEVLLRAYHPNVEMNFFGDDFRALGFAACYRGHEGYRELMGLWRAEWFELRFQPEALIDLGDRLVMPVEMTARGATSGAPVAQTYGNVLWFDDGLIVRQDVYWEWADCVEALGPADLASATRR